ncbi:MAG TPA: aromatic ring-hydroxylating dioxygenase subunit alpha [Acidimicrobiia bacterium]|nr:aromatic ring-hydroxylating dioxygenase subunit alpha [Acidimicrobiia bacterium]
MSTVYKLPRGAYLDDAWFRREQEALIGRTWTLVASTDELPDPGDYVAAVVADAPILVVRGEAGELRAFHNLCRHRGMVMLEGAGNVGTSIDCVYHQWRYDLDGALRVVPQRKEQFPRLDPACWGLLPAALDVWQGMVFVHPDPSAPSLHSYLGVIPDALGSFRPGLLTQVAHDLIDARCNWKLFVENHVDVYHLWYLHEETLGDFDHTQFSHETVDGHWVSYEPLRAPRFDEARLAAGTRAITHLDERDRTGISALLAFPNLMFATSAEFFATYRAVPVAPDRSVIDLRIRAEPGADAEALLKSLHSFISEDIAACEAVQRGMRSPRFSVGPLARTHERPITRFHDRVLAALADP